MNYLFNKPAWPMHQSITDINVQIWHTVLLSVQLERPLCYIWHSSHRVTTFWRTVRRLAASTDFLMTVISTVSKTTSMHDYSPHKKTVMALRNGSLMLYLIWFIEEAKWLSCLWWCAGLWFIGVFMKQWVQFCRDRYNHYNNDPVPFSLDI